MAEYRPVAADDRRAFHAILRQAFDPGAGPVSGSLDGEQWPPALAAPRGLFADGELLAVCKLYRLEAAVRGTWTTIGGLGGVATPPEHRRQGHARHLLREALAEYRADGVDLVALWPSTVRFYRGLGWGTANRQLRADAPPDQLAAVDGGERDAESGWFRRLDPTDWERLRSVEVARGERVGLSLRRSADWWRERTLAPWPDEPAPYVTGYERDGGELGGYVLWTVQDDGDGRRLDVQDLAALDREAERALLAVLGDFDSQVATVRLSGPIARDLPELVPDPDALDVAIDTTAGPMVRLTDVERGLSSLAWPDRADAEFVLAVGDPLLDRNDGAFAVDLADGEASVERVEPSGDGTAGPTTDADASATANAGVDAVVDVGTLSRLAVGALDVDRAADLAGLEIRRDAVRSELATAFPTEPVCLREFF